MKYIIASFLLAVGLVYLFASYGSASGGASAADKPAMFEGKPVDIDLARMSNTMQSTYTYRLSANPRELEGQTMRLTGQLLSRIDERDGQRYFGCLLGTPGGCPCCTPSGVLEFIPKDGMKWPDDFPPIESLVSVTGRIKVFKEKDPNRGGFYSIPRLVDAEVLSTGGSLHHMAAREQTDSEGM